MFDEKNVWKPTITIVKQFWVLSFVFGLILKNKNASKKSKNFFIKTGF